MASWEDVRAPALELPETSRAPKRLADRYVAEHS